VTDDLTYGLGAIQSPEDPRDFPIEALYAARGMVPAVALPTAYTVPAPLAPVVDQGSSPMCVAYSSGWVKVYEDLRDQGPFNADEPTFFAQIGGGPNGAYTRDAFTRMLNFGYPPVGNAAAAGQHKIAAYYSVPVERTALCQAILDFGPVVLSMPWYSNWFSVDADGDLRPPATQVGGHAIVAVGWDASGLWLQNSWGTDFGVQGGRCRLPWAYLSRVWEAYKAVDKIEPRPDPVVYKYGGGPYYRGTWRVIANGSRIRKAPYLNGQILQTVPAGTIFTNAQTTDKGSYVNGSRRWLGDKTGDRWIHVSLVRLVR